MEEVKNAAEERVYMQMMQEQDDYQNRAEEIHELLLQEQAFNRDYGQPESNSVPFEYVKSSVDGHGYLQGPPITLPTGIAYSSYIDMPSNLNLQLSMMEASRADEANAGGGGGAGGTQEMQPHIPNVIRNEDSEDYTPAPRFNKLAE